MSSQECPQYWTGKFRIFVVVLSLIYLKTSMMWPSQNFLLYNGTIIKIEVNEWKNN